MYILNALFRFTHHSYRRFASGCCFWNDNTPPTEHSPLLTVVVVPSLTDDFTDFAHSYAALRLCVIHVTIYYAACVLGFSYLCEQWSIVDSLYFGTVVWCTIGYGDMKPTTHAGMFYTIGLALYGIVLLGLFLGIAGEYIVDAYHASIEAHRRVKTSTILQTLVPETSNPPQQQSSSSTQPSLARQIGTVILLELPIVLLVYGAAFVVGRSEAWDWQESLYYAVITGTTVGFGDFSPTHQHVRLACVVLLPLMVAVLGELLARIASLYMDRQCRQAEARFFSRSLTLCDLERMDSDQNGVVEKGEFLAYMLVALQKVSQEDMEEMIDFYNRLDRTKSGTLTKADLVNRDWTRQFENSIREVGG